MRKGLYVGWKKREDVVRAGGVEVEWRAKAGLEIVTE
jgi:hypothetical protein